MIGGDVEVVIPDGMAARGKGTERHVFSRALVAGGFEWVGCRFCDARLVRDGRAYTLHVPEPEWRRMVDMKAVVG